ncbi:MAG: c-type cytochrome, partial [Nitrospinales bacterium]
MNRFFQQPASLNISLSILIITLLMGGSPVHAASPDGPALAAKKNCVQCHRFSAEEPEDRKKAPDLFYAGNKFQENWLKEFLIQPTVLRQAGYITDPGFLKAEPALTQPHMALSAEEAKVMSDYLLSLKISGLQTGKVDNAPLSKGKKAQAKFVF